jgi:hypothetical protein
VITNNISISYDKAGENGKFCPKGCLAGYFGNTLINQKDKRRILKKIVELCRE